jgi:hypothetical protein
LKTELKEQWKLYDDRKTGYQLVVDLIREWTKSNGDLKLADASLKRLKGTPGWYRYGINPATNFSNMKCADWLSYTLYLAEFHLCQLLQPNQCAVVLKFVKCLQELLCDTVDLDTLEDLKRKTVVALSLLEKELPTVKQYNTIAM